MRSSSSSSLYNILCLLLFFIVFLNQINKSHALKAFVVSSQFSDYYADKTGHCANRQLIIAVTDFGSSTIANMQPKDSTVTITNSPLGPPLYQNTTHYYLELTLTLPVVSNYVLNLQFTLEPSVNGITIFIPVTGPNNLGFNFECIAVPQTPIQANIVRDLEFSGISKTSKFEAYFKLDLIFNRGIGDYQCQATDFSNCLVIYIGNNMYKATFDISETYTGDLTLNSGRFVFTIGGYQIAFDNPLFNLQYQDLILGVPTIENVKSSSYVGGVLTFASNQLAMPIFATNFKPLRGTFRDFTVYSSGQQLEFIYLSNKLLTKAPPFPTVATQAIINSIVQPQDSNWQTNTLYYMTSTFTTTTNKKFLFGIGSSQFVDTKYPFGLTSITSGAPFYRISAMFSPYQTIYSINTGYIYPGSSTSNVVNPLSGDTSPPTLKSITLIPVNSTHSVLSMQVLDSQSGVGIIRVFKTYTGQYIYDLNQHDLVSGTVFDGSFEKIVEFQKETNIKIQMYDRAFNALSLSEDDLFVRYGYAKSQYDQRYFSFHLDLTEFRFLTTRIDVSSSSSNTTLYLNFTLPQGMDRKYTSVEFVPQLPSRKGFASNYFGRYNEQTQLYEIDFVIPAKTLSMNLEYSLFINGVIIQNDLIVSKFISTSRLYIDSPIFDQMFPVVKSVQTTPKELDITSGVGVIRIEINVEDDNFIKHVLIQFVGDYDLVGFNLTISPSPSQKSLVQTLEYTISPSVMCIEQNYYVKYIYTEDNLGNYGESFRYVNGDVHPYYKLDESVNDKFKVKCVPSGASTIAPEITDINISPSFDIVTKVSSVDVIISVKGTVGTSFLPTCYFHSFPMNYISDLAHFGGYNAQTSMTTYICSINLPMKYGPQIGLSIYGISDVQGKYVGYSTVDLPVGAREFINPSSTYQGPTIDRVWSDGNKIGVSGTQLYKGDILVYLDNVSSKLLTFDIATGVLIIAGDYITTTDTIVYVSVFNRDLQIESNKLPLSIKSTTNPTTPSPSPSQPVTPTPDQPVTPTPSPSCTSDCGLSQGHGKCVNGGCVCVAPHAGIDCKSIIDTTPVIKPDQDKPSVNVTIPGTSSGQTPQFTSFISVVALRELDNTGGLLSIYEFNSDKWVLVNEGSSSNDQVTTVQYKYNIEQVNTTLVSTVQVFNQAATITFGNQQLYMNPSTIKFTFNITSYPFSKSTNLLQVVMNAGLESTEKVSCSYKEFVDDQSNSQYLKLQIEDRSLFGRFIKFGIIDGREKIITNTQLDSNYGGKQLSSSTYDESYIGLNIPYYTKYALLDPDFSVLIEQNKAGDQENSICTKESKKLTNAQIAGIVVGGAVFLFITLGVAIYLYTRNSASPVAMKLRRIAS